MKSSSQSSESFRTEEQFDNDKNMVEVDRLSLIEVKNIETKSERLHSDSILEAQNVADQITP